MDSRKNAEISIIGVTWDIQQKDDLMQFAVHMIQTCDSFELYLISSINSRSIIKTH